MASYFLNSIFKDIKQNDSIKLKKCASYLIYKITKIIPKIFESLRLAGIIEVLSLLKNCKDVSIVGNLCQSLQIIIKSFGDLETDKRSCCLSHYFETISKNIFVDAIIDIKDISEGKISTKISLSNNYRYFN